MVPGEGTVTIICMRYRALLGEHGQRTRGPKHPKMRMQGWRYLRWCAKHQVDPILYLEDRIAHAVRTGGQLPVLGRLCSAAALEAHRAFGANRALEVRHDSKIKVVDTGRADKRPVRPHQEKFKELHRGKEQICARLPEHSGGYHPLSSFCKNCSAKSSCISLRRL